MSPSETSTVFYGPVVNPKSLSSFQALPRCLLAVGATGQIDWIEEDVHESALLNVLAQHGSLDIPLVSLRHGEFILPGFVDTHTVRMLLFKAVRLRVLFIGHDWSSVACTPSPEYWQVGVSRISCSNTHSHTYHQWPAVRTT
jgi:hypothetical protein